MLRTAKNLSAIVGNDSQTSRLAMNEYPNHWNGTPIALLCQSPYSFYGPLSVFILGFLTLPVAVFGLCANVLSIRIFTHKIMISSPINWYLAVLSTSDFFILLCSFFMHCLPRLSETLGAFSGYRLSLYLSPVSYPVGAMSQSISVYMTILMSAHRFIGVCFPFRAASILTKGRIRVCITTLVTLAVIFNFSRLFEVRVVGECYAPTIKDWTVVLSVTKMRSHDAYKWIFMGLGQTIIMFIVPFLSLIILNSQIICAVHRTRRQHMSMGAGDDTSKRAELAKEISTSVMLVGIVLVFLTCNSLAFIVNILECADLIEDVGVSNFIAMVETSNLLVNFNASVNIAVYCLFSDKYRTLLHHYVTFRWLRNGQILMMQNDY